MVRKQPLWLGGKTIRDAGNLAISRARDFRYRTYVTMRGTTNRTAARAGEAASMLRFFQERVPIRSCSDSTANSEGDSSFQELCSRQSSRSNQILTVNDMASMRGRSYEICITSGRHMFGPRLTFTCKNMIETDLS